ncbi:MAG: hypothetical protein ABJO97_11015 [Roseibium sp.]|uniref:hypothetical protein n=1 Tax=Alphaproteobacteria TaxID=28211 RepID=UPI003265042F
MQKERALQQDLEDLNNERLGNVTGRMQRFLSPEAFENNQSANSGKKGSTAKLSALDILLLNDPEYARIHKAALDENRAAQVKVTDLQDRIDRVMAKLDNKIEETLDQAVTLPDGRKAFMNEDGEVYTTDGELVDQAIVEGFDWNGRPPLETYLSLTADRARLGELESESQQHGLRLGEILEALEDQDDPATKGEVQSLREEQDDIVENVISMNDEVHTIESRHEAPSASIQATPDQPLVATKFEFGS